MSNQLSRLPGISATGVRFMPAPNLEAAAEAGAPFACTHAEGGLQMGMSDGQFALATGGLDIEQEGVARPPQSVDLVAAVSGRPRLDVGAVWQADLRQSSTPLVVGVIANCGPRATLLFPRVERTRALA